MPDFTHLHCHTQFSLLDGASSIKGMMEKAQNDGMKAVALTDHGNMFGAFKFVAEASKYNLKPIVGCEFYLVDDRLKKQFSKEDKDHRYHQLICQAYEKPCIYYQPVLVDVGRGVLQFSGQARQAGIE